MGPNGTGKSTLASVIMGDDRFEVVEGKVIFEKQNLLEMTVDQRARAGVFLAMQYPAEVPGVTNFNFLKTAVSSVRGKNIGVVDFMKDLDEKISLLEIKKDMP